jgi:hypothetical protein
MIADDDIAGCGVPPLFVTRLRSQHSVVRAFAFCSRGLLGVDAFELDGCEAPDRGVTSLRVVPGFDPFEDRPDELGTRRPLATVEELELERPEEALDHRVVGRVTRLPIDARSPASRSPLPNTQDVYCSGSTSRRNTAVLTGA